MKYWTIQYEAAKRAYEGTKAKVEANPDNPWYKTELEWRKENLAECEEHLKEEQA